MFETLNLNDPSNISGMSLLMNKELASGSVKADVMEQNIIDSSNPLNSMKSTPIDNILEYENQLNSVMGMDNSDYLDSTPNRVIRSRASSMIDADANLPLNDDTNDFDEFVD